MAPSVLTATVRFDKWISVAILRGDHVIQGPDPLPTLEILGESTDRHRLVDTSSLREGDVVVRTMAGHGVTPGFGIRAHYVVRSGELVQVTPGEASDILAPAGAARRAYEWRVRKSGLTQALKRVPVSPGHGYEEMEICEWRGAWAAIERVTARQVWVRAATWEEALEVGAESA